MPAGAARRAALLPDRVRPAAGVIAGQAVATAIGCRNLITLDMGGTTAKAALIEDGAISFVDEYEIGAGDHARQPADEGRRLPAAHPGHRPGRGRGRRRLAGLRRCRRRAAGRAAQRRRRPRPGLLRARHDRSDDHRRQRRAGLHRPRALRRRRAAPESQARLGGAGRLGRQLGMDAAAAAFAVHASGTRACRGPSGPSRPSAATTCATSPCWRSAAAGRCTRRSWRAAWASGASSSRPIPASSARWACSARRPAISSCTPTAPASTDSATPNCARPSRN